MTPPTVFPSPVFPSPERLRSLDVFRGATIALMILVNNPGDWSKTYAPLLHAAWHGCTPTDLVFPFFLFIVGVAIPFALGPAPKAGNGPLPPAPLSADGEGGEPNWGGASPLPSRGRNGGFPSTARGPQGRPGDFPAGLRGKIARRSALLFALGLFLNFFPFYTVVLERVRLPGVLQRIAVVYLCTAFAWLYLSPKARAGLAALLLAGYWAAMKLVPAPGFGAGDLSPEGNLAFHLDHLILGAHTWRYSPGPGDPEGLLSTLPAIVTALCGVFCGELLRRDEPWRARLKTLFAWATAATLAGLALQPYFPLNKNLWSPTYVLFTAGLAMHSLALLYLLVDVKKIGAWARPFEIFGKNSILAFVGSGILAKLLLVVFRWQEGDKTVTLQAWLYRTLYAPILPDYVASLAWALTHVLLWLAILAVLDRKKLYLKV